MKMQHRWHLLVLLLLIVVSGCGNPELYQASGRLTYKGQPVPSTYVTFMPDEEGKRASTGLTDDNGNFKLNFSRTEDGVYPGKHTVFLKYSVSVEEELGRIPPKANKDLRKVIDKYGDLKTSPLKYEITKNGQHIDIVIPE